MSQNIQLQKIMVNLMVIEVGGDDRGMDIIGRMLHRRKGIDLLAVGQHHDTARMLSCGAPYPDTALHQSVNLRIPLGNAPLLVIFLHHAEGGFVRQRADGAGLEGIAVAEDHTRVGVRLRLVFAGEVQIDIRLLVAVEAQEGFKGNIKAPAVEFRAALRALLRRHVAARHTGILLHLR